ncbi:O-antigen ligase family protein [Mycolicibacterium goodii]|uniref:O-antigen ligase family protein n=1 Tax=Mycolicibacterium goodii TaxID=134601 RepID=A0ABS6HR16_MYCGD|nr:O-antigen ligase family protein [Mycolicibacterium goodii]MBU8823747.1 O-antigen ligase family protein [Mycolicibacterium goodii]MBU8833117.1 O-antigen ligase family protein [Mycolicibacterium goodii]MBU8835919.1 O-antigen ligase family protein [Mycolicibacterium goodii]
MTAVTSAPSDRRGRTAEGESAPPAERTPWLLGFLCFLIPALPTYVVLPGPLKSNGSPARMIAVLFFGLVVLGFVVVRRSGHMRRISPGAVILLVYFMLWLTTYGVALHGFDYTPGSTSTASSMMRALIAMTANVGVGLYVVTRVRTLRQRHLVLGCLTVGLAFASLVGLLQTVASIDLRYLFQPPGFVLNTDELSLTERGGVERALGTSSHAIEYAVLATVLLPLAIYFARHAATRNRRVLSAAACILAVVAMPTGVSRTGIISLGAALLVLMLAHTVRQIVTGVVLGVLAVGSYVVAFPRITTALWDTIVNSEKDPSVLGRTADYAQVSETFREHPVFGLGLGASPPDVYGYLDNEWLQAVVQGGVVGVVAMLLLTGGGIFGISAALRRATTRSERDLAYTLGACFAAIMVSSFTFDVLGFQQVALLLFIFFGLLWSTFRVSSPGPGT